MALTVEQMLYGVWCHSTLRTDIWYAAGNVGLVTVQKPTEKLVRTHNTVLTLVTPTLLISTFSLVSK